MTFISSYLYYYLYLYSYLYYIYYFKLVSKGSSGKQGSIYLSFSSLNDSHCFKQPENIRIIIYFI